MSATILIFYDGEPPFPPEVQHPDAVRSVFTVDGKTYWVDHIGALTQEEFEAHLYAIINGDAP